MRQRIAVIGLGFVGLTTALGFARRGHHVIGFDNDISRVRLLDKNRIPFHEPHLREALVRYKNRNFSLCDNAKEAVSGARVIFYCVGTPANESGRACLGSLTAAVKEGLKYADKKDYKIFVIKSTVPPAASGSVIRPLMEKAGFEIGKDVGLAVNPEFLREGYAWNDFMRPDRIVIGEYDKKSGEVIKGLYRGFNARIYRVSPTTAEFIKYLSNILLSNLISFANEMSMAADAIGDVDIARSFKILHMDKRWSGAPAGMTSYVYPGCGFGGYCLPKDTLAFCHAARHGRYRPRLIREVLGVNKRVKAHIVDKIIKSSSKKDYIGVLGLSFKPGSDDVRDTPAKDIIEMLMERGFRRIIACDPMAVDNFKREYGLPILYTDKVEELARKCDSIVLVTAWPEFKAKKDMFAGKRFIDGRYVLGRNPG